jgi:hypothetical protein
VVQKVSVSFVDDLDGGDAAGTVEFGLDGVTFEIDLSDGNASALRETLAAYVEGARRTGGRARPGTQGAATAERAKKVGRLTLVRAWAVDNWSAPVNPRGRLSNSLLDAYDSRGTSSPAPAATPTRRTSKRK